MHSRAGLPFVLSEDMEVAFVPPRNGAPRAAKVVSVKQVQESGFLVHFDAVPDIGTAERLVGCYCLVKRSVLPPDFEVRQAEPYSGFEVTDESFGRLGIVASYSEGTMQALFEVEDENGTILIPDVPEFIIKIDDSAACILTKIPAGLLDLAQGTGAGKEGL